MKELFNLLPTFAMRDPGSHRVQYLVDTCFLYHAFEKHEKQFVEFCKTNAVGITSFNVQEALHHAHHVNHHIRERIRHEIKAGLPLSVVDIPVHPGDPHGEYSFVENLDPKLIHLVPDHSDAVLVAAAKAIRAHILTRDKHHVFTTNLQNYFQEEGLQVLNNFPD